MVQQQKRIRGEFIGNRFPMGKLHGSDMYWNSKVRWFLRKPNWKNIQMQQFEKNLYQEHPHTAGRSMAEVEDYRNANGVSVKENDVPKAILALEESNFLDYVTKAIEAQRDYTSPTCIDAHCWSIALSCRNFLGIAETGSPKALAYVLPAVIHVRRQPPRQRHEGPIALVVAPTRELAKQIHIVASELGEHAGLGSVCAVSGDCRRGQYAELQKGCHILVATPGHLIEFLDESKFLAKAPKATRGGFARRLYVEVKFSATPLPVQNSVEITVGVCQEEEKKAKLAELFEHVLKKKTDRAVVFTERRWKVEEIAFQLRQRGWPAIGLHGKRDKEEREWVLSMFSSVAETVLVTTDVVVQDAELGKVGMVVNYDCPGCSKVYAHRSRHVQLDDKPGMVHTFVVPTQHRQAETMVEILDDVKQPISTEFYGIAKNVSLKQ
ncbi:hypothetical protein MRX96_051209 [Rhipicephalus microplus]